MKIAFFDSGIGGITVLKEALDMLPEQEYVYYADTEHVPYGIKPKEEVKQYIFEAVEFIVEQGVDVLVVACNTATSIAIKDLRANYELPILGMEPAVKPAVKKCDQKKVLAAATPLTLKEDKFQNLVARVDPGNIVDSVGLPKLVEFAEDFVFAEEVIIDYLQNRLSAYDLQDYGTVVLGCTHFIYYQDLFRQVLPPSIDIIDGNRGTVRHLQDVLTEMKENKSQQKGTVTCYVSGEENNELLAKYLQVLTE